MASGKPRLDCRKHHIPYDKPLTNLDKQLPATPPPAATHRNRFAEYITHQSFKMKPIVSAGNAWTCTIVSVFAMVILTVIAILFRSGHEEFVGGTEDPSDGKAVSGTIFTAVIVYAAFFVFCGLQGLLHVRESRRGAIAL
ncbi:hypothetical protein B0I35DRAFT_404043 [Stachybotrys elegans]|uniref:Uncharacterized protein n=1 Tax=Stachybotrys elegans TaxID=80388 RepID=A0A8K0T1X6_9HYPO|nr:hypothetical protein B0I35DRAFT_404043 [Stachybotrys elegans]